MATEVVAEKEMEEVATEVAVEDGGGGNGGGGGEGDRAKGVEEVAMMVAMMVATRLRHIYHRGCLAAELAVAWGAELAEKLAVWVEGLAEETVEV